MLTNTIRLTACSLLLSLAFAASAQSGVSIAQSLAATCANCHGTNGRLPAQQEVPALAGRSAEWIRQQVTAFRNYGRASTVMQQIVRGYSDEEIELIANYLAKNGG
jgi:cytochrome c553